MKKSFLIPLCAFALVAVFAYDTLLEVNAEIPRRIDVTICKTFQNVEINSQLYINDLVLPGAIHVDVESNLSNAFEVILFSPRREGFFLVGNANSDIDFHLRDVRSGKKVFVGEVLYSRGVKSYPEEIELIYDLVIPRQERHVSISNQMFGQIGVNIQDV